MPACVRASASARSRVNFRCSLLMSKVVFIAGSCYALKGFPKGFDFSRTRRIDLRPGFPGNKGAGVGDAVFDRDVRVRKHAHDAFHNVINPRAAIDAAEHRQRVAFLAELIDQQQNVFLGKEHCVHRTFAAGRRRP